jgi:hypothetical protein
MISGPHQPGNVAGWYERSDGNILRIRSNFPGSRRISASRISHTHKRSTAGSWPGIGIEGTVNDNGMLQDRDYDSHDCSFGGLHFVFLLR